MSMLYCVYIFFIIFFCLVHDFVVYADQLIMDTDTQKEKVTHTNGVEGHVSIQKILDENHAAKLMSINFDNEDLVTVINQFAKESKINIILPQGTYAINQKVTLKIPQKISLQDMAKYIDTMLDIAGYSLVPHGNFFMIVKNDLYVGREPLPLFVDVPPQNLPPVGRIQVIYYLKNIKVPDSAQGTDPLNVVLNDMLSPQRIYNFDSKSNAIIIRDKADLIKATMSMILRLDAVGVKDVLQTVQLYNTSAAVVANLLQNQILAVTGNVQGKLRAEVKSEAGLYFDPSTKIVHDGRTNSLIILGKEPSVQRIIDFIRESIDIPIESGRSILHYYELQYLDSEQFAEVLKKIVTSQSLQANQSSMEAGSSRLFDGVVILAEKMVEENITQEKLAETRNMKGDDSSILKGTVYRGGNRIIVVALDRDWKRIKKLIGDLDKPQLQIIIQVLIIDFDVDENKIFGMQTRNPSALKLPNGVNFQTTHLMQTVIPDGAPGAPITNLAADLLNLLTGGQSAAGQLTTAGSPVGGSPGSLILSFNDSAGTGIWTFLQWLDNFGATKVLSHPYLVTLNNHKAEEVVSTIRRVDGDATTGEGGILARKQQEIEAALKVSVVPHASSADRVNLHISIAINDFVTANESQTPNLTIREVHTDVNMGSGQMLVIGGLTRNQDSESDSETPLLGKIPFLRMFFSASNKSKRNINTQILIIPTVVQPKLRTGANLYTRDTIDAAYKNVETGLFDQMRDPITYLFLRDGQNVSEYMLEEYLSESTGDFVHKTTKDEKKLQQLQQKNEKMNNELLAAAKLKESLLVEHNPLLKAPSAHQTHPNSVPAVDLQL